MLWSRLHSVETIQIVLDAPLLRETDRAARRLKVNRSALVRAALQQHLKRLQTVDREARDREGYRRRSQDRDELAAWDRAAAWPDA
jgi:metal-responsive CopG/Arc/MetJ family transcriptional regulator